MQLNRPLPKGFELEGHRIVRTIARGGFAFVYLARDASRSLVALKEYMPKGDVAPAAFGAGLRCFFEEARALAALRHPNVIRVHNFFRAHGTAYMAMQYESGSTLQQHIETRGAQPDEEWLRRLFVRLLNGLREVHAARLLHLDIKPANVWIREDGSPVLIDFGAARRVLSADAAQLPAVHTPGFAAPEHASPSALGPWSDIYSIGATLYSCLAGEPPSSERARRRWAGRYSEELLEIIDWCMRPEPRHRPESLLSLQKSLAPVLAAA